MKWAALITWVITALGGFALLGIWLQRGGLSQADKPGRRIRPPLIFGHMTLAATGLVLWIIYVASDTKGFAWAGFVLLLMVASLGFAMLALWIQRRQASPAGAHAARVGGPGSPALAAAGGGTTTGSPEGSLPAEQHFPVSIVGAHGLIAATTLVLALLAALNVGGS